MTPEETALEYLQVYLVFENYFFFSVTVLCCYDYILTLDREIKYIWKADLSLATSLYYAFRYAALFNTIMVLLTRIAWPSWQSISTCGIVLRVQMVLDIIVLVSATIFAALRVYAIFSCNKWMFGLVLLSGMINPVISIYIFVITSPDLFAVTGFQACIFSIVGSLPSYETWMIAARAASLVSDGLVLTLTCMKTVRKTDFKLGFIKSSPGSSLQDILLRDTTLCFAFLCVVNVIGIATGRLTEFIDIWQTWTAILTSVLLSRLALDLREASAAALESEGTFSQAPQDLAFAHEEEIADSEGSVGELDNVMAESSSFV
ncbi:uncharacterized protein LAESUDRAFT_725365 [Laetiporus sulphureus 93-53]|uniref:DUF6533 domain-containing protein n=1 Tax=Laetiporus sulphureus 93-53 TaxID=1314785 RepID=A0A165EGY5_9APHY|nr:uncharacterized protein LAESUDRAFT_725365 [Laetiporus sulphureus 93-53]KZT07031.1 hypothetical protein LAESUDRAFT_725365 [Laetiporus sulphureus 93-53]